MLDRSSNLFDAPAAADDPSVCATEPGLSSVAEGDGFAGEDPGSPPLNAAETPAEQDRASGPRHKPRVVRRSPRRRVVRPQQPQPPRRLAARGRVGGVGRRIGATIHGAVSTGSAVKRLGLLAAVLLLAFAISAVAAYTLYPRPTAQPPTVAGLMVPAAPAPQPATRGKRPRRHTAHHAPRSTTRRSRPRHGHPRSGRTPRSVKHHTNATPHHRPVRRRTARGAAQSAPMAAPSARGTSPTLPASRSTAVATAPSPYQPPATVAPLASRPSSSSSASAEFGFEH